MYVRPSESVKAWILNHAALNNFASNCLHSLRQYGTISDKQNAAIERNLSSVPTLSESSGLDLSNVPAGRYAVPDGDTRLKVMIKKPEPPSKWAGWIFVTDAAEYGHRQNYGRQAPGKPYSGNIRDALAVIARDPKAAAMAYGKLTGTCGICGRHLEDEESVALGIGPICRGKFA